MCCIVISLSVTLFACVWVETQQSALCAGDVGDHVVVINTKDVAMQADYWRTFKHFHHTG